ncbi:hypothetical protein [Kutzneria sp. CA-103260]|uniref:hypothetical protein n=1 Tax=Kutzneria sp. CA-103260 TaxID=2802641 RepID=UPI001BA4E877|nr:hypothetical protein [Kutzneria sp. CA-103260]
MRIAVSTALNRVNSPSRTDSAPAWTIQPSTRFHPRRRDVLGEPARPLAALDQFQHGPVGRLDRGDCLLAHLRLADQEHQHRTELEVGVPHPTQGLDRGALHHRGPRDRVGQSVRWLSTVTGTHPSESGTVMYHSGIFATR